MSKHLAVVFCSLVFIAFTGQAQAHHGWSAYDAGQALTLEVPIKVVNYRNPHADLRIEHAGKTWEVVLAPVGRLQARGLPESDLVEGKTVTIVGYPRKDGTAEIRAERIIVDSRTIELR